MGKASAAGPTRHGTGIEGLDFILGGGLPRGRLYLISGDPGVGKTTLALQFLLEGARRGEKCLYISLSESEEELREVAASHGWDLSGVRLFELTAARQKLNLEAKTGNTVFHPSEIELGEVMRVLLDEVKQSDVTRVVFDSLSEIRLLAQDPLRYRLQILLLKEFFADRKMTVFLLDDRTAERGESQLESICHGVIELTRRLSGYGAMQRRLSVLKLRGVDFRTGENDYVIRKGGITVFPRLVAAEHPMKFEQELVSSGIPALDDLLGGGVHRGRSVLVIGSAGLGKSTLAAQYVATAGSRGEKSSVYVFDERPETLLLRCKMLGIDLETPRKAGNLLLRQIDPAEVPAGQFSHMVIEDVKRQGVKFVVIDSLNGYLASLGEDRHLILHLHELLTYLGQKGVITLLILGQQGLIGAGMVAPLDASYLADVVILLRYFENEGAVHQAISVLKQRTGGQERTIREFRLGPGGIEIGAPLKEFHGVLTGVPTYEGKVGGLMRKGRGKKKSR